MPAAPVRGDAVPCGCGGLRSGGIRHPIPVLAGPPSPQAMPFSHSTRQAEPLLPLAVFLLAPLLLAAGVRRHAAAAHPTPAARAATVPAAAPLLPPVDGTRGR